ncbi:DNA cytosine methyltransferase [Nocardioides sp. Arc9.136]|uniref:DNA cytosine methyltransferase n=1 Tax=Nocardioides sp. Arc9.136 TaxID=2996826 RepID=UPI002665BA4D|nr:DNA cytosine methyltransferase [Nocardioides sp. Arc9.136]WKN48917.1 DNA cytosine methyltransferase [Nocardioides sp. Arc9.136]
MRTAIDLFAGAGGATQGLRDAGFDVVAAVENDAAAAATWRANHPGRMFESDIRAVDTDDLRGALPEGARLDLLKACPPCQGFSSLRGADPDPERNDLVLDTLRLVDALQPRVLLLENVPGLARDTRFSALVEGLDDRDYAARHYVVEASELGVPQRRRRLVLMAVHRDEGAEPPAELADLLPHAERAPATTVGQAFSQLVLDMPVDDEWHRWRRSSEAVRARIAAVPVNGTRLDLPEEHQLKCHTRLGTKSALASYGRIKADGVSPTMTTRCTTPACGSFIHPTEHRGISVREAAALQTFPARYKWTGGYDSVERQIGNAVPVRMAEALGRAAGRLLDGSTASALSAGSRRGPSSEKGTHAPRSHDSLAASRSARFFSA